MLAVSVYFIICGVFMLFGFVISAWVSAPIVDEHIEHCWCDDEGMGVSPHRMH